MTSNVVGILCGVLDLVSSDKQDRLLRLIDSDKDVKEAVANIEDLCSGPLAAFTEDELKVAGKVKMRNKDALTSSDSWLKLVTLSEKGNDVEEALGALIDHNMECSKIASAFRTQTSRLDGSSEKFAMASLERHERLKNRIAEHQTRCAGLDLEFRNLDVHFGRDLSDIHQDMILLASRDDQYSSQESHGEFHYKCRDRGRIFNETTSPQDHILTKLQALGAELEFDIAKHNALVSDARCFASEIVWFFFHQCRRALDLVYSEAYESGRDNLGNAPSYARAVEEERQAIIEEIQSLWDEVVPVAHMAVEKEFLRPLLKTIEQDEMTDILKNATISSYTSSVLRYMNQRLEALAERFYILFLHHQALFEAYHFALARTKGDTVMDLPKSKTRRPTVHNDDRSSIMDLLRACLTKYGSIPVDIDSNDPESNTREQAITKFQEFVTSRNGKLSMMYSQMQDLFEGAAKSNLGNVEIGRAILSRRILADGSSGLNVPQSIHQDDEAEEAIQLMEDEVAAVRDRFGALGLSGAAEAPDFVLHAYLKAHKRLATKDSEGCLNSGNLHVSCPACIGCSEFVDFISRWGDA